MSPSSPIPLLAMSPVTASPLQTPAPDPALLRRQAASDPDRVFAYWSRGEKDGMVIWGSMNSESKSYWTSSADHWRRCRSSYTITTGTSISTHVDPECYFFTECADGWIKAASTSLPCNFRAGSSCFTHLLFESYGATDGLSWLFCGETAKGTGSSWYRTKPPDMPATALDAGTTSTSTSTTAVSTTATDRPTLPSADSISTPSSSQPSETAPPQQPQTEEGDSTPGGAIAGGIVGGLAVLAIAAVVVFYIWRRGRSRRAAVVHELEYVPEDKYRQVESPPVEAPGPELRKYEVGSGWQGNELPA